MPRNMSKTPASSGQSGSSSSQKHEQPKQPHAAASATTELCRDALLLILGFLGTARGVGRCAAVNQAWRDAANDAGLWKRIVLLERPALAATVLPLVDHRLPAPGTDGLKNGRLHPWHPKRLLKKHWRTAKDRKDKGGDSDVEEDDEEDGWAARQRKEEKRWRARFRDCYLQLTITDADDPTGRALLTKLFPLSDKAVVTPLFGGAVGKDALCAGAMPDFYQDQERPDKFCLTARSLLPRNLEAILSAQDLSGAEPKAAHLLEGNRYVNSLPGVFDPDGGRDAFKPNTAAGGMMGDFGYYHLLEIRVEDAATARGQCRAVAAAAPGRAAHVHFGVSVMLLQYDKAEVVDMDALESWKWMDGTWSKLAWK